MVTTDSQLSRTVPERNPQEVASFLWLDVLFVTRWTAILGVIVATLVATQVFHINFATLPAYIICGVMAVYNLILLRQTRSLKAMQTGLLIAKIRIYGSLHIILDLLTLTVLLHFTGGIENPFIFYLVLHMIGASIALPQLAAYSLGGASLLVVTLLVVLEYAGVIPHINLAGFAPPTLYQQGSYILAMLIVLASTLFLSTYMATSVSSLLRKRQEQVVELREQLLEEKIKELELSSKEVARLEEEKSRFLRFLAIAAHDLKAPLTAIQGFLWVMLGGYSGELTDKQRNMLERSSRRITELLSLISDLLDIPRIEAGQILPEIKETSLDEIIKSCVDDLSSKSVEKGIKLKVKMPPSLPKINGSSLRLHQLITNLVDNAITYTPEGEVTIRVSEKGNDIWVEVIDTGIGITAEDLPRLFEDFFRGSNVEVKGTGLGLSIAKRIVEAHKGKIWCESPCPETNKGSKFTFTLPKVSEAKDNTGLDYYPEL